jgi:hypothetical protein
MSFDRKTAQRIVILAIILVASILRIRLYGHPALSISGNDTLSYVEASRVPLFSNEIFTGRRLLTTNLVYKFLEPSEGYQITINGSLETTRRGFQPGFNGIAILQAVLSILGWGALAWGVSDHLKNFSMKLSAAIFILAFAFTPHMADWDSILMSESLTFSLFALQLTILLKMVFALHHEPKANITTWLSAWTVIFFLWTFIKDTNLFTSLVTFGMIAASMVSLRYRKVVALRVTLFVLAGIFILGFVTSSASVRSLVQITNIYNDDLLPSPLRVETLRQIGMPEPGTPDYHAWFPEHAKGTLARFMLTHPGYPLLKIVNDFPMAFEEISQTYFKAPELGSAREILMQIGNALHPENTTPFVMSVILLVGLMLLSHQKADDSRPWAWLGLWVFLTASVALIPTILGDTWALNRHALFSTMIYRLSMWLFAIILMDLALSREKLVNT